jgi:hypothetical protein
MWHNKTMHDDTFIRPVQPEVEIARVVRNYAVAIVAHNIVNVTNMETVFVCWNSPPEG